MTDINTTFCRMLLTNVHTDVKKHFPAINLRKDAYVYNCCGQWEFGGPDGFFRYVDGYNAYEARANGWMAFLASKGIDD